MKQAKRKAWVWLLAAALLLPAFGLIGCGKQEQTADAATLLTPRERLGMETESSPDCVVIIDSMENFGADF